MDWTSWEREREGVGSLGSCLGEGKNVNFEGIDRDEKDWSECMGCRIKLLKVGKDVVGCCRIIAKLQSQKHEDFFWGVVAEGRSKRFLLDIQFKSGHTKDGSPGCSYWYPSHLIWDDKVEGYLFGLNHMAGLWGMNKWVYCKDRVCVGQRLSNPGWINHQRMI